MENNKYIYGIDQEFWVNRQKLIRAAKQDNKSRFEVKLSYEDFENIPSIENETA